MAKEISLSFTAKRTKHKLMKFRGIYQHFINYKVHKVNLEADFVKFRTKENRAIIAQKYNEFWRNFTKLRSLNHYRKLRNFVSFCFVMDRNLSLDPNFAVTYLLVRTSLDQMLLKSSSLFTFLQNRLPWWGSQPYLAFPFSQPSLVSLTKFCP